MFFWMTCCFRDVEHDIHKKTNKPERQTALLAMGKELTTYFFVDLPLFKKKNLQLHAHFSVNVT